MQIMNKMKYKCENCNETEVEHKGEWCKNCDLPENDYLK